MKLFVLKYLFLLKGNPSKNDTTYAIIQEALNFYLDNPWYNSVSRHLITACMSGKKVPKLDVQDNCFGLVKEQLHYSQPHT